ncbi:HlyD family secretion protein, partial [Brevundimonas naejangsanensis]
MTDAAPPPSAPAAPPAPPAPPPPAAAPAPSSGRRVMWSVALIAMALVGIGLILHAWRLPPFSGGPQTTDNAYVRGQVTIVSPQVSGYVTSVEVQDFQTVKQGQLLATIDDRIYRQRLEQAQASLHSAEAALANSAQSQASARGSVAQTRAAIAAAQSAVTKARADATR